MTEKEFLKRRDELLKKHKKEFDSLYKEYALANNTVNVGDVVSDGLTTIKVEKIDGIKSVYSELPACIYTGTKLLKNGKPAKRQDGNVIFQDSRTRIISRAKS